MAQYELKDDATGMSVVVESERDLTEQDVTASLSEARKLAAKSIETGRYKIDEDTNEQLDKTSANAKLRKYAGYAMGINPDEVDIDSGMGLLGRLQLDLLPDEGSRIEFLQKKYGDDNVSALNIGGKTKMFYRDPKTKKMTMVDEMGASLADFTADIAGEAITTAGAVGGAVAGSLVPGVGTIAGATAGAALGGFVTGVTQDVAAEVATGQDIELGQKMKQRGIEMAIGIPIDLVSGVGGKILGRTFAKRKSIQAIDDLVRVTDELNQAYGSQIKLTAAQEASPDASMVQSMRAGLDPRGREAQWYNDQLDEIGKIRTAVESGVASNEPVELVMAKMAQKHLDKLEIYKARVQQLDEIALEQKAKGKTQKEAFKRKERAKMEKQRELEHNARVDAYNKAFDKMRRNVDKLERSYGRDLREQMATKIRNVEAKNNELYEEAYRLTDTPQANTPVADVERMISRIDEDQFIPDSPELMALKALKKRIATDQSDLTFRELDAFVRQFGDRVNFKKKHGLKFNELSFRNAYKSLNKLWDDAVGAPKKPGGRGAGAEAAKAHRAAREDFRKNVLPLTEGSVARSQAMRIGGMRGESLPEEFVTREALSNSQTIKESIEAGADRETLKKAYLEKITREAGDGKIKYDKNILDELYKTTKQLKVGGPKGASAIMGRIDSVNKILERSKIGVESIDKDLLDDVVNAYDAPAAQRALRALETKAQAQKQLDAAKDDILMKVIRGEQPAPEDIHIFVDSIAKKSPGQINKLMARLSPSEQNSLRRSGIDWMLGKAGAGDEAVQRTSAQTGGQALWNPDQMHKMLNNDVTRSKLEALVGKNVVEDFERMNTVLGNAAILRQAKEGAGSRVVLTTGASGVPTPLIVSPGIPRWLGRKMLGVIHTSPLAKGMLRRWLMEPDKESAQQLFERVFFTAIGTRAGMAAAADEGQKDPRFSAWLENALSDEEGAE